jgi:hypothetical protein
LYETKDTLNPEHGIVPGDWVWVKRHRACTLEERWNDPYLVILVTPTALKVDGVKPISKNRKRLESGPHGGTQITH